VLGAVTAALLVEHTPMGADASVIGCTGRLVLATRGADGPGEVVIAVRGGTEVYIAWSEQPLARGTTVLAYATRGERALDVMEWAESSEDPGGPPTT
jgi:hypothetical protein